MWVETTGGFVGFDVDGVVELVDAGFFAPGFGIGELGVGRREIPAAGAEVAEDGGVVVGGGRGRGGGWGVELLFGQEGFESE